MNLVAIDVIVRELCGVRWSATRESEDNFYCKKVCSNFEKRFRICKELRVIVCAAIKINWHRRQCFFLRFSMVLQDFSFVSVHKHEKMNSYLIGTNNVIMQCSLNDVTKEV